ncbi:MAG: hypothetical protein M3229_02045 [Actinomycetota bacterium]|nr:hypothetical protein [Actinomycetota bacterium]
MKRLALLSAAVTAACGVLVATSLAGDDKKAGFHTSVPKMLQGQNGATTQAIISVGDTVNGHTFDSIPDGISISKINGKGTFDILLNHELSPVPFPATRQDYSNALVSKLRLHQKSAGVLKGEYAIPSNPGYQRFCSNFIAGPEHGFERSLLLTNEEARDIVLRQQDSWHQPGVTLAEPNAEQAGVVVAYDVKSGAFRSIYGMGRHNHENSVGVPGYGYPVVLSGDDTFDAPASQLYLYKAASGDDVWNDRGALYAFRSDNPAINDYGDVTPGMIVTGHFLEVPRMIATGKRADGKDVTSADFGYPPPPSAAIPNGPQWVLEHWSNVNNVFQFIRIEDTAYDRTNPRIMYMADTGEPRAIPDPATGRLMRGPSGTQGPFMNGRLFKLELGADPLTGAKLSIMPNGNFDALGYRNATAVHQPDNVETTKKSIFIQEDPGSHNSQPSFAGATNARVWRYDIATGALTVVAEVDQSMSPVTNKGAWESSGIVDASAVLGAGAFLVDIQAHGWDTPVPGGNDPPAVQQREHGQLLVLRVPGEGVAAPPGIGKVKGKGGGEDDDHPGKGKAKGRGR